MSEAAHEPDWYAAGHWRTEPLWQSFATAALGPGLEAKVGDDDGALPLGGLLDRARRIAGGLAAAGMCCGDAAIIQSRNTIDAYAALLACFSQGFVAIPLPPMFSPAQVAAVAGSSRARVLILLDDGAGARVSEVLQAASHVEIAWIAEPVSEDFHPRVRAWDACLSADPLQPDPPQPDADHLVLYSSGSTGTPKGVVHSGNSLRFAMEALARLHGIGPDDRILVACEFGFVGGTVLTGLLAFLAGASATLMRRWDAGTCLAAIEDSGITYTLLMPTHCYDVLNHPDLDRTDTRSLTRAIMAGATPGQRRAAAGRFCGVPLPMYGMSESPAHCTCAAADAESDRAGTDGRPLPGTQMRVLGDDGEPVAEGEIGNVHLRGPNRMRRYQARPGLTNEVIRDGGWFATGDRGRLEPGGYLTFVARASELIRRGGVMIQPTEIELVLRDHPAIAEIAVIGVPDERLGQRGCACAMLRAGQNLDLKGVQDHLAHRGVPHYQWPEFLLVFDEFPRTPSLKIKRADLASLAAARVAPAPAA